VGVAVRGPCGGPGGRVSGMKKAIDEAKAGRPCSSRRDRPTTSTSLGSITRPFSRTRIRAEGGVEGQDEGFGDVYGKIKSWTYYTEFNYQNKVGTMRSSPASRCR